VPLFTEQLCRKQSEDTKSVVLFDTLTAEITCHITA